MKVLTRLLSPIFSGGGPIAIACGSLLTIALLLPTGTEMVSPSIAARAACGSSLCIQIKDNGNAGVGNSVAVALDSNQTAGSLNTVSLFFCDSVGCSTGAVADYTIAVTDTLKHTYTQAVRLNIASVSAIATYYVCNTTSGANTITITITPGGAGTETYYLYGAVSEFSGITSSSCLDQTGTATGNSATATVTTGGATSQANELVYGFANATDLSPTSTALSDNGAGTLGDQYKTVSSTGSQSLVWNVTSGDWRAIISTYKEAAAGTTSVRRNMMLLGVGR